jgi:exopolysaccharide biosynthesis polyprenyl glycosylphosphotransferase
VKAVFARVHHIPVRDPLTPSDSPRAPLLLEQSLGAWGISDRPAGAGGARAGVRGSIVALADRRETARALLMIADAAAASVSLGIGVQFLLGADLRLAAVLTIPFVVLMARVFGLYERLGRGLGRSTLTDVPRQFQLATLLALVASLVGDRLIWGPWTPAATLVFWLSLLVTLPLARAAARWLPAAFAPERCVVIGDPERAARVRRTIVGLSAGRTHLVGWVPLDQLSGPETREALAELVRSRHVDHVVIAPLVVDTSDVIEVVRSLEELDIRITLMPRLLELASATLTPDVIGAAAGLDVRRLGLSRGERWLKRAIDLGGAVLIGIVLAPALLGIAVAISATSRGGVLFRQQRVGRDGRTFSMFKFRTMVLDAEARKAELRSRNQAEGLFKLVDDPRVTRVGRLLRRTSLDELPQLLNVLRGDMSLVGPRPLIAEEDGTIAGWHRRRLRVRPGMSGVWQVMGSARVPLSEMVELDYLYVLSWSPWLDLKILVRTAAFVVARRGM